MKMIGMRIFSWANVLWKYKPLGPGSLMSRTRQLGTSGSLLCRNSGAEPNVSAPSPTDRKRLVSALRSEGSSSITNTTGGRSGASFVIRHGTLATHRENRSAAQYCKWPMSVRRDFDDRATE